LLNRPIIAELIKNCSSETSGQKKTQPKFRFFLSDLPVTPLLLQVRPVYQERETGQTNCSISFFIPQARSHSALCQFSWLVLSGIYIPVMQTLPKSRMPVNREMP